MSSMRYVLAAVFTCACSQGSSREDPIESMTGAVTAAPTDDVPGFEVEFMTMMIDHHWMAVEAATLCVERATHKKLRRLCEDMIEAQTAEIEKMQRWLRHWYEVEKEPMLTPEQEQQLAELAAHDGADFEVAFMTMMIEHHTMAVHEGEECVHHAHHRRLIRLCEKMVEDQTREIALMEHWLAAWYPDDCPK